MKIHHVTIEGTKMVIMRADDFARLISDAGAESQIHEAVGSQIDINQIPKAVLDAIARGGER